MIRRVFVFFLLFFSLSYSKVVQLKSITLENIPDEYRDVFRGFLLKNFSFVSKESPFYTNMKVSWTGTSYVVCFDFYEREKNKGITCFTALTGEDLYTKFFSNLKDFVKTKENVSQVILKVKTVGKPKGKKVRLMSEKGDILVGYKAFSVGEGSADLEGILNLDTISLNGENSRDLLKLLLKGNRVKQILIIQ